MTDNNEQHMTPKDFAPHVLVVIAELADYQANVSVPMGDTYKAVCERMGIDEDYGGDTSHGSKFTHRSIGLAMRQLRDRNLTTYAKKGHWACTAAGILEAAEESGHNLPAASSVTAPLAARANATAEVPETEEDNVVRLPLATPTHPYSDDPYIRQLAIESVACFGAFSKRSKECKECPLTEDCITHAGVLKAEIAAEIAAEEAQALARAQAKAEDKAKKDDSTDELIKGFADEEDKKSRKAGPKGKFKPAPGQDVAPAQAQRESLCIQCKEVIPKGTQVKWANDEGVFHPECIEDPNDQ